MSKRTAFTRYSLIINKLRNKPCTFIELHNYLEQQSELHEEKYTISKRTFLRDIEEIAVSFGVEIEYDFSQKVYCIVFNEESGPSRRILESFDVMSALRESSSFSNYVDFERGSSKGTEYLYSILHCIRNRFEFEFLYQKFSNEEVSKRRLKPFALKEFKHRWYVVGRDSKSDEIRTFGLDRILSLQVSEVSFSYPKDFNVSNYFKYSFGVIRPQNQDPQKVILSFSPLDGKYIKSTPLHSSQKVIVDNSNEVQIELQLYITYDFIMELLQYSNSLGVIEPVFLKEKIFAIYKSAL